MKNGESVENNKANKNENEHSHKSQKNMKWLKLMVYGDEEKLKSYVLMR